MTISVRKKSIKEELTQARTKIRYLNQELLEKEQEIQLLEARLKETPMYAPNHHEQCHTAFLFEENTRLKSLKFKYAMIGFIAGGAVGIVIQHLVHIGVIK